MVDLLFISIFIVGVYYIIRYRFNLKKAVVSSKTAMYPQEPGEFTSILLPGEWKEMEPLDDRSKSYRFVKWGTSAVLMLLLLQLWVVLATDWLDTSFFSAAYLFFVIISAVRHRGNFFILSEGIILNARYYSFSQITYYKTEKVSLGHELYGLDSRVDNGFKLTFNIKNKLFHPDYVIVEDRENLDKITSMLEKHGITSHGQKSS